MICLGNICRSPMAEGIMRSKIEKNNLTAKVDSCGTANYHVGDYPDYRAQSTMKKHGIDISAHLGRQFQMDDFDTFDLIYTMDQNNFNHIFSLARNDAEQKKVKMIMNEVFPGENRDVPDPYYGTNEGFEETYKLLDLACEKIANGVKKLKV